MWQPYRVLLMGVPTLGRVDGRSQSGAVYEWISSRDVHQVFYSGFGDTFDRFINQVIDIRDDILNQPAGPGILSALFGNTWPRFYNTVSTGKTMNIINYQDKLLPLFPIEVEAVIVLANHQYRRQMKTNPNKLAWKAWYDARNIPVLFMREDGIFDTT